MPIYHDVAKRTEDPAVFRQIACELLDLPFSDWTPWEEYLFLPAMLRYDKGYVYSEKERAKLAELCWLSEEIEGHDGQSVANMVAICIRYHADFQPDDSDWIVDLDRRGATFVRRRQMRDLIRLVRFCGIDLRDAA